MNVDEAYVLEHFGVKGMKWGKRKDRASGGSSGESSSTPAFKGKAVKVAAVSGLAIGAGLATYAIKRAGGTSVASIPTQRANTVKVGANMARQIAQQRAAFKATTDKMNTTVRLADNQLRDWNNKFDVPIPQRVYLRPRG